MDIGGVCEMRASASDQNRDDAIEACRLLNDFVGDLVVGTQVLKLFESKRSKLGSAYVSAKRMCFIHLMIVLSKLIEFYDRYKAILPPSSCDACRSLVGELKRRGVYDFRNKCVCHILDKKTKRPLTVDKITSHLTAILQDNEQAFLLWLNNPCANEFPRTVVSIVEHTRAQLLEHYGIGDPYPRAF